MLTDSQGNALIDENTLPAARELDGIELTALTSAILRVLVAVHGPEIVQLIALHAEAIEDEIRKAAHPPVTDEAYFNATAETLTEV